MSTTVNSKGSTSTLQAKVLTLVNENGLKIFLAVVALVFIGFAVTTHNYLTLFNIKTMYNL